MPITLRQRPTCHPHRSHSKRNGLPIGAALGVAHAAKMWERSALAHIANVKTPTMLIHGELDQDVVVTEPEQMFNALKQRGVEAVFVRYPRAGHSLREPRHVVDAMERSVAWYERHLPERGGTLQR